MTIANVARHKRQGSMARIQLSGAEDSRHLFSNKNKSVKTTTAVLALTIAIQLPSASLGQVVIIDTLSSTTAGFILVETPPSDQRVAQGFRTDGNRYQVTGGAVKAARIASSIGTPYASIFTIDAAGLPAASIGSLTFGPLAPSFTPVALHPTAPIYLSANTEYLLILGYEGLGASYLWDITSAPLNTGAGVATSRTLVRTSALPWDNFSQPRDALLRLEGVVVPEPPTARLLVAGLFAAVVWRTFKPEAVGS